MSSDIHCSALAAAARLALGIGMVAGCVGKVAHDASAPAGASRTSPSADTVAHAIMPAAHAWAQG